MQKQQDIHLAKIIKSLAIIVVFAFAFISSPKAQMFDFEGVGLVDDEPTSETAENSVKDTVREQPANKNVSARAIASKKANVNAKDNQVQNNKVTIDKVENINPIDPNEKIYMYMRNFKISRSINGRINCDMRFYLASNVKEKITNISYRLKWPNMETSLSYSNVDPEGKMYKDYTLLGEGCYEMDKAPNIIVNRCRIKGRTQEHCASIIKCAK